MVTAAVNNENNGGESEMAFPEEMPEAAEYALNTVRKWYCTKTRPNGVNGGDSVL